MITRPMYPPQKDSPSTFLTGDISATDTFIIVGNAGILPQTVPFPLTLGIDKTVTETVMVTEIGVGNNQLTVTRPDGALAWLTGTKVARVFNAADLTAVQQNLTDVIDQSNANAEVLETLGESLTETQEVVGDSTGGLVKGLADEIIRATTAEQTESTRAQGAEAVLNTNKVNRTELPQVLTDWAPTANGTAMTVTITRYNASSQTTSTYTRTIPLVSDDDVGLMTPEAYTEITDLRTDVAALQQQGGRFIGVSFATKDDLDNYTIPSTVKIGDFTYVLDDETHEDATTRYIFDGSVFDFAYVINYDPVGLATSTTPGLVKSDSGTTEGKVFVELDGTMSVIGWDDMKEELDEKFVLPAGGTSEKYLNGLGEWSEPAPSSGVFVIRINFESSIPTGAAFTVTGGSLNYNGTVPASHLVDVPANDPNVTYTVVCGNSSSSVTVANLYGIFLVTVQGAPTDVTCTPLNASYGTTGTAQASASSSLLITWSAQNLPAGFSINQSTGVVSGSTTTIATGTFTVRATSTAGYTTSDPIAYDIQPLAPNEITGVDLIGEEEGIEATALFSANQNGATINWTTNGLPSWASVLNTYVTGNVAYCVVGGTPGAGDEGEGTFSVTATNSKGTVSVTKAFSVSYYILYGFDLTLATASPTGRVVYPSGVANSAFTPAAWSGSAFNYGGWAADNWFMPKPCMLNANGTVAYFLNPNNYAQKADGTASDIANTSFNGNAMMQWPKIFVSRTEVGGVYKFRICNIKLDSTFECWSNYDQANNEIPYFYTPIYFGSNISSKLRSLSGQANMVSQTGTTEVTYAKANGTYWYTEVAADRLLFIDLCILLSKSTDSQTAFGAGRVNSSSAVATGTMNDKGLFWNGGESGVKVFGMEHPWGNLWRRTAGWILLNGAQRMKLTRGTKDGSTVSDYNETASGYLTVTGGTPAGTSGGYISGTVTMPYGRIPQTASGSSTTYDPDPLFFNNSGTLYAIVGGNWADALQAGASGVGLNNAVSVTTTSLGASLSCKPLV